MQLFSRFKKTPLTGLALLICGIAAAQTVPPGGPVLPDLPLAKAYNDAAKAARDGGVRNPILDWAYRVWCETGYRTAPALGVNGIDNLLDPLTDLVTPKGFLVADFSGTVYPAGGVQFLDNAWVFGRWLTAAVVVRTPSGNFLVFDALNSISDYQTQVIDQMRFAGLDPARVTHLFVGHAHGDHYAGVELQRALSPNMKVIAGAPDATSMLSSRRRAEVRTYPTPEARAAAVNRIPASIEISVPAGGEGQEQGAKRLQLESGVEVVVMMTPGHTSGAIQVIVPVMHKGKQEKLFVWSGNDANNANTDRYATGGRFVEKFVVSEKPTAWINTHTYQSATFGHLEKLKKDPNAPNPMLMGEDGVRRFYTIWSSCNRALAQRYRDGTWEEI